MAAKKNRDTPMKRDPRFSKRISPIEFDNADEFEIEKTPEEKSAWFLSRYMDKIHPFTKFKNYFDSSAVSEDAILGIIKREYRNLVLDKNWTEAKFVAVTNEIFETDRLFTPFTYGMLSKMYENNELSSQQAKSDERIRRRRL